MEQLTYRIDLFEGPLDLLLSLIQKNKFDISDIPIALICDQYMEYITAAAERDLEISSEFIVMASRLMLIKSRMLLPKLESDEEDPRAELAAAVLEYARAKEASSIFSVMYSMHSGRMVKDTDEIKADNTVSEHDVSLLSEALSRILSEAKTTERAATRFTPLIQRKTASATEKAYTVMRYLYKNGRVPVDELFANEESRSDMIAVFLAILELLRSQRIIIVEDVIDDIDIKDDGAPINNAYPDGTLSTHEVTLELIHKHKRDEDDGADGTADDDNDDDSIGDIYDIDKDYNGI